MKYGKSFFNGTLLRRNLTRFWPAWVGFCIVLLLFVLGNDGLYAQAVADMSMLWSAYGLLCGMLVMGYLFVPRYANALHGLPLRREGLLLVNLVSGLLFLAVPLALSAGIALVRGGSILYVGTYSVVVAALVFYGFSLSLLACMVTGTRLGAVTVWFLLAYGVPLLEEALWCTLQPMLWGVYKEEGVTTCLAPSIQMLTMSYTSESWGRYLAWVTVASLGILGLTWLLYRRRKTEAAGDFVAFRWMRPVVKYVLTALLGLGLGLLLGEIIGVGYNGTLASALTWLLPGMLIARLAAEMLVSRSVRVFQPRRLLSYGACLLVTVAVLVLTDVDVLGLETRVPDPEDVVSVAVQPNFYNYDTVYTDDPAVIQEAVQVHQLILEDRGLVQGESYQMQRVFLRYRLKNGMELTREYWLEISESQEPDSLYRQLRELLNRPENLLAEIGGEAVTEEQLRQRLRSITISFWNAGLEQELTREQSQDLLEAVILDIQAGNLDQYLSQEDVQIGLQIETQLWDERTQQVRPYYHYSWLNIPSAAVNTLACIESLTHWGISG